MGGEGTYNKMQSEVKSCYQNHVIIYLVRAFGEVWQTENIYHANAKIHAKLMEIALTLPLTSTSAERAFSKLKLVKSRRQERLESLMLMSVEGDLLELDEENLVKAFINVAPRRMDLV